MNLFARYYLYISYGVFSRKRFDGLLLNIALNAYMQELNKLPEWQQAMWHDPSVDVYFIHYLPKRWAAYKTGGGIIALGTTTRAKALKLCQAHIGDGEIIFVDDTLGFIFYKE